MSIVLITGGSRGIGAAAAKQFAQQGDTVIISYCQAQAAAEALQQQYGIHPVQADFRQPDAPQKLAETVLQQFGTVDILVNNAAVSVIDLFQCVSAAERAALYQVNLFGTTETTRAILPAMIAQKRGCILNIASMWGEVGASCEVDYSVTKGAIIAFTKALAKEVGMSGIRVNAVSPGVIDTEMNRHLTAEDREALAEETPLQRIGTPEEAANAICFLASEHASFITGQILDVNGGYII